MLLLQRAALCSGDLLPAEACAWTGPEQQRFVGVAPTLRLVLASG